MLLLIVLFFSYICLSIFLLAAIFTMLYTIFPTLLFFGGPYVVTRDNHCLKMIDFSQPQKGEKMLDLGSGDGRIVIAFAKNGIMSYGYEINPYLVAIAKKRIKKENLENIAFVNCKNFWKEDVSDFDIITIYPAGFMMEKLEEKLKKELKPGARLILNGFKFPNWKSKDSDGRLFLYEKPLV